MPTNPYINIGQNPLAYSDPFGDSTSGTGFGAFGMDVNYDPKTYQSSDLETTYRYDTDTTRQLKALDDYVQQRREEGASADELKALFAEQSALDQARKDEEKAIWDAKSGNSWIAAAPYAMLAMSGAPLAIGQALGGGAALGSAVMNAANAVAQGKDIGDIAKSAALSYAGGALGDRIAAGTEFGINPFGEQAGMLADQASGISGAYGFLPSMTGETAKGLVQGKDLEQSLIGGALSGLKNADFGDSSLSLDIQTPEVLKDIEKAVIRPAGEALGTLDKEVLQPLTKPIAEAAQYVDDTYIDPFVSTVQDTVIDPIQEVGREIDRGILQPTKDVIVDVGQAIGDAVPDINLPSIDWKGLFGALLAGSQGMFSGGGGVPGTSQAAQDAIQTELLDYKPITPYRSKLSPSARLFG